ncbi:MAG TPA: methylenetetrahydrofolate reductase [NAD(P)H] [Paracoccaceae bacterium]|nr:methylenetetrahydrofolate reductase [NAD(P)H] [Paracoccaceae bacterium]
MQNTQKAGQTPSLSFEYFPPANPEAAQRLWRTVNRLNPLGPEFVSVTYGAGGTTQDRTIDALKTMTNLVGCDVAGHLTCVGASRAETLAVAQEYKRIGVKRIVALRGDAPKGQDHFTPHPDGFRNAAELVAGLSELGDFKISVGAYPEKHPDAPDFASDIENLKRKLDAGATNAISQFFFDNDTFYRFRDACAAAGITKPIFPGILPIEKFAGMVRFAKMCQATVPAWLHEAFEGFETPEDSEKLAVELCTKQSQDLLDNGEDHLHFYTLNNPVLTYEVCRGLGFTELPVANAC